MVRASIAPHAAQPRSSSNSVGRLSRLVAREGTVITLSYDGLGQLASAQDSFGHTITMSHVDGVCGNRDTGSVAIASAMYGHGPASESRLRTQNAAPFIRQTSVQGQPRGVFGSVPVAFQWVFTVAVAVAATVFERDAASVSSRSRSHLDAVAGAGELNLAAGGHRQGRSHFDKNWVSRTS